MEIVICGKIDDFVPYFNACLDQDGNIVLAENGNFSMTVDTGFNGGIALPFESINKMGLEYQYFDTLELATGEVVDLPVFLSKVIIKDCVIETSFIPGNNLIGMEFLSAAGSVLSLNFKKAEVKLMK